MKLLFTLDCGRTVKLEALHCCRTYGGLIEGRPHPIVNQTIMERARGKMYPVWGARRTHVVPPVIDESDPDHPALPLVQMSAWLTCWEPIHPGNVGSDLVVIWYRQECEDEPFNEVIHEGIRRVAWDELASDIKEW
jgi:hypothetical protein